MSEVNIVIEVVTITPQHDKSKDKKRVICGKREKEGQKQEIETKQTKRERKWKKCLWLLLTRYG